MLKELITRVIQPTSEVIPAENFELDDIHEKIRKGIIKLLSDAGYTNLTITIGPKGGCSHENCTITGEIYFPNIPINTATEILDTSNQCILNAAKIVFNEILGPRHIINYNFKNIIIPIKEKKSKKFRKGRL
jgi:hypothetical protein